MGRSQHGSGGGRRDDLGGRYFRSGWEANFARYLNWLVKQAVIAGWEYEPDEFEFHEIKRGTRFYTPDFKVHETNGGMTYYEVKGWWDATSKTKVKRFRKYYPQYKLLIIGEEEYSAIARDVRRFLPHWE